MDGAISDTQRTPQQAYQLGLLMAQLHQHSSRWKLPSNFERPLYDANHFYASLSKLNSNEQIRPIDFALCGFGYYLYDVASALQYLTSSIRFSFLEGYNTIRQLPENYIEIVEAFFILAVIDVFSNHVSNPKEHEWLAESVSYVCENHVSRFLRDEPFLFNLY
ncbi:aminoglycoside phosphotransferase/kinase family protein [Crocosphaera chwakensis]|uniref:Aminoglycoside phosphotransferase domain-containing protein n=1 Tax=Crocosphaera chwakensis CCY0110 TaxID=391612 RepID=A3IV01_9CHRO|nr:hypothetical protein [Crocosphaera chwakensis]EAZ89655.1 hypothetical protein CY0110_11092 [Crocosphaera chwakensis CCY0110]